ncbi:hypothetical protein M434DRAFT_391815 [Hypoxylon sp. CO27-5]|nr:hypothetical protein M434DRAFT_391815 [Hypoxylon sp. CO27-5]
MASRNMEPTAGASLPRSRDTNERQLLLSCEASFSYPCNLAQSLIFEHTLESYRCKLHDESERLFNPFPEVTLLKF